DTNDIILKMLSAVAKGMDQNMVALHATNSLLEKEAHATPGSIGRLWLLAPLWVGVLVTLARLPRRDGHLLTTVIRLHPERAEIATHMESGKPIPRRGKLVLQHERVVMVPTEGTPKKNNPLVRPRLDRVLQRLPFFSHCHAHGASHPLA